MFLQKSQKALAINWAFNGVVCDNSIKSDSRKDGESVTMNEAVLDMATNSFH